MTICFICFIFDFLLIRFCLEMFYMMLFSSLNHSLLFRLITQVHSCIHTIITYTHAFIWFLFNQSFWLTLIVIRIDNHCSTFLGCYKPYLLKQNLVPRFEK